MYQKHHRKYTLFKNINDKSIPGNILNSCLDIITIWNISENSFGSSCLSANKEWIITNNIYFIKFTFFNSFLWEKTWCEISYVGQFLESYS